MNSEKELKPVFALAKAIAATKEKFVGPIPERRSNVARSVANMHVFAPSAHVCIARTPCGGNQQLAQCASGN